MTEVIICSAAEEEYAQSLLWYAERNVEAARAFDAGFDLTLQEIAADPARFPACDDHHRFVIIRRFPFRVIFRILDDCILIIAVAHTSRSPGYWAGRGMRRTGLRLFLPAFSAVCLAGTPELNR